MRAESGTGRRESSKCDGWLQTPKYSALLCNSQNHFKNAGVTTWALILAANPDELSPDWMGQRGVVVRCVSRSGLPPNHHRLLVVSTDETTIRVPSLFLLLVSSHICYTGGAIYPRELVCLRSPLSASPAKPPASSATHSNNLPLQNDRPTS